ncbi:MAG TPA: cation-translocating P-type ATPase [Capsulimonadaceae bacterium]
MPSSNADIDHLPGKMTLLGNRQVRTLLIVIAMIVPFEIGSFLGFRAPAWVEVPLFLGVIGWFGHGVILSGLKSLARFRLSNINVLMTVAILGALYLRQYQEAAIVVTLFALGEAMESFGVEKSQTAINALVERSPKTATVKGGGERLPIDQIQIGQIVVIRPGEQIPLDGEVTEGSSLVDEATITGEPIPKSKHIGDAVYAGTLNTQGYLEARVTRDAKDSTLSRIIKLTAESAEKKARVEQFIDRFSAYYTPLIIVSAALIVVIPVVILGLPFEKWFTQALTILIIGCPCALVMSTPIAVFSAIGNATGRGALIKGGRFIEVMGSIKAIALDKTRTLTRGEPVVSDVIPINGYSTEELLACAAGIENFSEHPLAQSIVAKADEMDVAVNDFKNFQSVLGKGVKGDCLVCSDSHHCLGSIRFVSEEHAVQDEVVKLVEGFEKQGKTTVVLSSNKAVRGVIAITDEIRPESRQVVSELRELGIAPVIVTGDNGASARYVASSLGIDEVHSELLPDGKVDVLNGMLKEYGEVGMLGDGVNDAPALASASVGLAMGAIGSDAAIENADIALMGNNLLLLPFLVRIGRAAKSTIRFNITAAVATKLLFLGLAVAGHSTITLAIFADVGVTVLVILNSLRLYSFE